MFLRRALEYSSSGRSNSVNAPLPMPIVDQVSWAFGALSICVSTLIRSPVLEICSQEVYPTTVPSHFPTNCDNSLVPFSPIGLACRCEAIQGWNFTRQGIDAKANEQKGIAKRGLVFIHVKHLNGVSIRNGASLVSLSQFNTTNLKISRDLHDSSSSGRLNG